MPNVGPLEIAIVLVIALVIFGPKRLPELGKSMGKGIREFKGSLSMDDPDEVQAERSIEVIERNAGTDHTPPSCRPEVRGAGEPRRRE